MESREEEVMDFRERNSAGAGAGSTAACSQAAEEGFDPRPPEKLWLKTSPAESHSNLGFPAIR